MLRNELVLSKVDKQAQYAIGSHLIAILKKDLSCLDVIEETWSKMHHSDRFKDL